MTGNMKLAILMSTIIAGLIIALLGWFTVPGNRLGWFLLISGGIYCLVGPLYLAVANFRQKIKSDSGERSFWLIVPGLLVISLIPPLEYLLLPSTLPRTVLMEEAGLILLGAGLFFFLRSRYALEFWDIGGSLDHPVPSLTHAGIMQVMRYPAGIGLALLALGICIGYSSLIGLCVVLLILLPGLIYLFRNDF